MSTPIEKFILHMKVCKDCQTGLLCSRGVFMRDTIAEAAIKVKSAQQRMHLTAIAVGGLAFIVGVVVGWLWFGA